jgi:hypothetical protein
MSQWLLTGSRVAAVREARRRRDSYFCLFSADIMEALLVPMIANTPPPWPTIYDHHKLAPPISDCGCISHHGDETCHACLSRIRFTCQMERVVFYCRGCARGGPVCQRASPQAMRCGFLRVVGPMDTDYVCRWCAADDERQRGNCVRCVNMQRIIRQRNNCIMMQSSQLFERQFEESLGCTTAQLEQWSAEQAACDYTSHSPSSYRALIERGVALGERVQKEIWDSRML